MRNEDVARRQGLKNGWKITARKQMETVIRVVSANHSVSVTV
jgi:hypothetical protein